MTTHKNIPIIALALAVAVALGALLFPPIGANRAWSEDPADNECLDCHDNGMQSLMGSAHDLGVGKAGVTCLSCHIDADGDHLDDDEILPFNPASQSVTETSKVCMSCHVGFHATNSLERDPHGADAVNCTGCHKLHDNNKVGLLADDEPELCFGCHAGVEGEFYLPSRHPVTDHVVRCSDCHLEIFQDRKQGVYSGPSATCFQCHARFRGPFPFQHQAAVDYSTEEGGCLNCHAPHGSTQPRLLKQPYDVTNQALCASCHFVPRHENNSFHGTQWAGVPCSDCHVDIHGSYFNRNLLDPGLQSQGCFNAGCHGY